MFIDVGLIVKVFIYVAGGIMPFVYNYYFVKRKVSSSEEGGEVKNNERRVSDEIQLGSEEAKPKKTMSVEPITLSNTLSLHYIHSQESSEVKGGTTPLYVLLVIDQNTMNNPETLNKVISDVPKIVGTFETSMVKQQS
ncbi:MAG: hypothetical protein J7J78_03390 [Thermoprotei archaeon]|nr:hypothetical protein [Thermoprotei archaeon]